MIPQVKIHKTIKSENSLCFTHFKSLPPPYAFHSVLPRSLYLRPSANFFKPFWWGLPTEWGGHLEGTFSHSDSVRTLHLSVISPHSHPGTLKLQQALSNRETTPMSVLTTWLSTPHLSTVGSETGGGIPFGFRLLLITSLHHRGRWLKASFIYGYSDTSSSESSLPSQLSSWWIYMYCYTKGTTI